MMNRTYALLGKNLQDLTKKLCANQNLCKLLYYTDDQALTKTTIPDTQTLLRSYIKVTPPKKDPSTGSHSYLVLVMSSGETNSQNSKFSNVIVQVFLYVPNDQWVLKGEDNLRPFALMDEIASTLRGTLVEGLGKLIGGDFEIDSITEEVSCYILTFGYVANV